VTELSRRTEIRRVAYGPEFAGLRTENPPRGPGSQARPERTIAMSEPGVTKSKALSTLLDNHRLFLASLEQRVGTKADAEDILQTAFVKMIETPTNLRNEERVVAWFYEVLRNALSDHYRRRDAEQRAHRMAAHPPEPFRAPELYPELEAKDLRRKRGALARGSVRKPAVSRHCRRERGSARAVAYTPTTTSERPCRATRHFRLWAPSAVWHGARMGVSPVLARSTGFVQGLEPGCVPSCATVTRSTGKRRMNS